MMYSVSSALRRERARRASISSEPKNIVEQTMIAKNPAPARRASSAMSIPQFSARNHATRAFVERRMHALS